VFGIRIEAGIRLPAVRRVWRRGSGLTRLRPGLISTPPESIRAVQAIVFRSPERIGNHRVRLVEQTCVLLIPTEIRMCPEFLHEGAVTGFDNRQWSVRLDVQYAIVIAPVLHLF